MRMRVILNESRYYALPEIPTSRKVGCRNGPAVAFHNPSSFDRVFTKGSGIVILGIGIDQVDTTRIADLLDRFGARGEGRLFTDEELRRCGDRPRPSECLAARFAAKEAFVKALGTGMRGMTWTDIEVQGGENERPQMVLHGNAAAELDRRGGTNVHVSLTHEAGMATAIVVLESAD